MFFVRGCGCSEREVNDRIDSHELNAEKKKAN